MTFCSELSRDFLLYLQQLNLMKDKTRIHLLAFIYLSIFLFPAFKAFGQTELDSLYVELSKSTELDSLYTIQRICQILPYDSSDYGLNIAQRAFQISLELKNEKFQPHFIFYQGLFNERQGRFDLAMERYRLAYKESSRLKDYLFSINSLFGVSVIHQKTGKYDASLSSLDSLRTEAVKHIDLNDEIFLLFLRGLDLTGDNYSFKGDYDEAISWYNKIVEKTSLEIFPELLGNAYKGISTIYTILGNSAESVDYGHKALKIFESTNNSAQVSKTLNELGRAYLGLGELDKSLEFFKKSLAIKELQGNRSGMAVTLQNIGVVHRRQKNYGLALENYERSKIIKEELGIEKGMSALSINIGIIHKNLGEYKKAEEYYFDAIKKANKIGNTNYRDIAVNNLSSLYLSWSKFDLAKEYAQRSVKLGLAKNSIRAISDSYYNLHEAYKGLNDFKNAYSNYVLSMQYNDSLVQQSKASEIARIEQEYAKESDERKLELQDNQMALLTAQERLDNNQKYAFVIGALLVLAFSIVAIRSSKTKAKREKTLLEFERDKVGLGSKLTTKELENEKLLNEHSKLKLSVLSHEIAEKNKRLGELEDDLERLTKDYISDEAKERKGLAETILTHGRNGEEWSRFMEYFQNVYHDYLGRLKTQFTDITPNELRLCALIKINLSTKEIANALNITPDSLRTAKYRLRKKLKLETDENLSDFLLRS